MITLDPDSKSFFRYDLEKNEYFYEENQAKDLEKERIDSEINNLEYLKGFDVTGWRFISKECERYRKRAIWQYLLQSECSDYPAFISNRELSSAFADEIDIKLTVDISGYVFFNAEEEFREELRTEEKEDFHYDNYEKLIRFRVSLVYSANEAMKLMKNQVNRDFSMVLTPFNDENQFVFQVKGRKEYLNGNFPLFAYRYIRELLRGGEVLILKLTEIPKIQKNPYPTYVSREEKMPHIENFLMFYGPSTEKKYLKPRIFFLNSQNPQKTRKSSTETLLKGLISSTPSYSGENDWPFRVKICGLENLFHIFTEGLLGSGTNNGHDHPAYVILPNSKKEIKNSNISESKSVYRKPSSVFRLKSKSTSSKDLISHPVDSNYISHGDSCQISQNLANQFKLPFAPYMLEFDVMLIYGEEVVENCFIRTQAIPFSFNARTMEWVTFPVKFANLPKETRLGINIYALARNNESFLIGSVVKALFDEFGECVKGLQGLNLWPFYKVEARLACMQEFWGVSTEYGSPSKEINNYAKVYLKFDNFQCENVTWSLKNEGYYRGMYKSLTGFTRKTPLSLKKFKNTEKILPGPVFANDPDEQSDLKLMKTKPQVDDLANLEKVLLTDPLEALDNSQKKLLFLCRDHYKSIPSALPLFLRSVNWFRPLQVSEALKCLEKWGKMPAEDYISLLNSEYPDENIRLFASRKLSQLPDDDIVLYLPQLTQVLSFEIHHFSSIGELLLERSLKSPHFIGHSFFWALRSQLYVKATAERFGLILEQFLMLCGGYRSQLLSEQKLVQFISDLGTRVTTKEGCQEREKYLKVMISENIDASSNLTTLPVDSAMEVKFFVTEECKIMDSKKMPMWITLKNTEAVSDALQVIYKVGDDLRQDILTLQMIRVMDNIWLENGLDLRMKPYRVIVTGDQEGIIEVVPQSETTSDIQKKYGGTLGALRNNTLKDFLLEHNSDLQMEKALDNFIKSCAGYCVASYILGIADRHNGNIMITKTGHLFHIDFGHFLGNFKSKFGIKRERSKFVFTEEMAFAMGGKTSGGFALFKECCSKAYNLIRKNGKKLINLFMLMTSAGMPELQNKSEIEYIRYMLSLKLTETEAIGKFNEEIENALGNTFRRIDNLIHNLRRN